MLPTGEFLSPVAILKEIVIPVKEKAALNFKGSKTLDNTKGKVLVKIVHFYEVVAQQYPTVFIFSGQ